MFFDLTNFLFNPFVLIFAAIFFGMIFGKIEIKNFSFGGAGPLFAGLVIGYFVLRYAYSIPENSENFQAAQNFIQVGVINNLLFNTFLVLFVTAIGLLASQSIWKIVKEYGIQFIILGFLITGVGAATNYAITSFMPASDVYQTAGTYTGSMTSSPGLAAALETVEGTASEKAENYESLSESEQEAVLAVLNDTNTVNTLSSDNTQTLNEEQKQQYVETAMSDVGIGHSIAFPFGSLVVILSMTFLHKIFRIDLEKEKKEFNEIMANGRDAEKEKEENNNTVLFDITGFALAALVGLLIGNITIPLGSLGSFSLGTTGGALVGGLLMGSVGKLGFINFRMNEKVLQVLRTLCLEIFLAIVGLRYGYGVVQSITGSGLSIVIVAFVVAAIALLSGFLVGRYVFKMNYVLLSGAICGGMTNTTGMGTLLDVLESDDAAAGYGATFPFAMIGMVIFTILLQQFI